MNREHKIESLADLEKFFQSHMDHCHEIFCGRVLDTPWDDYWKGVQGSYVNAYNAVQELKLNLGLITVHGKNMLER